MRVLLPTVGSSGDVFPFIALGAGLARRGHRATVVTNPAFEEAVRREGLDFSPIGTAADYRAIAEDSGLWDPRRAFQVVMRRGVLPCMRPIYDAIAAAAGKDTIVAASSLCFGARIAQEKLGVALASVHLQPAMFRSAVDPLAVPGVPLRILPVFLRRVLYRAVDALLIDRTIAPEINAFRRELGLPPVHRFFASWVHSPTKVLGLFPSWFAAPQPDWPPHARLTGFLGYDAGGKEAPLEDDARSFLDGGEPPIVFTAGTANLHARGFFEAAASAVRRLGRRALLLTRERSQAPERLPASVLRLDYAPFRALLPRCAALVHHGGIGTLAQALGAGIPQLVTPLAHDQHDNAARLERLGAGASVSTRHVNGQTLAGALDRLLGSVEIRRRASDLAGQTHFDRWLEESCDAILSLA